MNKTVSQEFLPLLGAAAVSLIGATAAKLLKDKVSADAAGEVIKHTKAALGASQNTDLVRVTQSARVEPILLMDQRAATVPFIQDVVHSLYNLFTGYWLLAVSLDATINGVSVGRRLDKFATDRDLADATAVAISAGLESINIGLPYSKEVLQESFEAANAEYRVQFESLVASLEKLNPMEAAGEKIDEIEKDEAKKNAPPTGGTRVIDPSKIVQQITNLAVGSMVEVTISEDGKEAKVPVMIRLRVAGMNPISMVQTLALGGVDLSMRGRWRAWRAGELRFWADFVMAMDRVDAHRAASMNDETGYYKTVYNRARKNSLASILTQGPSLATASSIIVITQQTQEELEREIGGQLSSFKVRQGIFGQTYSMLLAVVDPDWESVTIYTRGIDMPTKLSKDMMKTAGKSDSKELMDILKSYQLGKAPGRI